MNLNPKVVLVSLATVTLGFAPTVASAQHPFPSWNVRCNPTLRGKCTKTKVPLSIHMRMVKMHPLYAVL